MKYLVVSTDADLVKYHLVLIVWDFQNKPFLVHIPSLNHRDPSDSCCTIHSYFINFRSIFLSSQNQL